MPGAAFVPSTRSPATVGRFRRLPPTAAAPAAGGTISPPVLDSYQDVGTIAFNSSASPETLSITVAAGGVIVLYGYTSDAATTLGTPTGGTGLTWTLQRSLVAASRTSAYVWTTVSPTGQTFNAQVATTAGTNLWGFGAFVFSGSDGVGVSAVANATLDTPTLPITPGHDHSALVVVNGDWQASDSAARVWATINGIAPSAGNGYEKLYHRNPTEYVVMAAYYPDAGTAAPQTVTVAPSPLQNYAIIGVEVLGTASAGGAPVTADAALTVTTTTVAAGTVDRPAASTVTVTATTTASAAVDRPATASLTATASVTADATVAAGTVDASLTATAAMTAAAVVTRPVIAAQTTTAAITAAAAIVKDATASVATTASVTAAASTIRPVTAALTATATVTSAAVGIRPVAATATITATITADGVVGLAPVLAQATLTGTATLTAAATVTRPTTAALTALASLTAAGVGIHPAVAALTATVALTAAAVVVSTASATLTMTATLTAVGVVPDAIVTRPDTGTTTRPGAGTTPRPATGTTAMPATGTTLRPNTGTVIRP